MFRAISADDLVVDTKNRTVGFSFSSEYPVDRWFGKEVLSHAPGAADLNRLQSGANLLWNHDMDQVRGVIQDAKIDPVKKKGYVQARFSKSPASDQLLNDIDDGIIKNVSFGYRVKEMSRTAQSENEGDTFTATSWEPYEVSFVSVPADPTVGVGRSDNDEEREVKIVGEPQVRTVENKIPLKEENKAMEKEELAAQAAKAESEKKVAVELARKEATEAERVRQTAISSLGEKFNQKELARQLIEGGKSVDEARAAFLEKMGAKQVPLTGNEGEVGLTEKEKRTYSWTRALNFLANPSDPQARKGAGFEIEVSQAAADKAGKASRGLMVPIDVLRYNEKRDLSVGTSTAGGDLVATNLLAASFIEVLRNKSVLQRAGAMTMNGLVGNIAIPKQTAASTAYWVAEASAPTEADQTVGQVSLSPKTVAANTNYSRKLLLQSSIDVENFVRNDIAQILALAIDLAGLYGLGSSNQPQGIKPALSGGSQEESFAGSVPTFAEVVGLETKITSQNADLGAMSYLINASMQGSLKTTAKIGSTYPVFILEDQAMNGYPVLMSNQIASGDVFMGVWNQLIMGFWSGLDLLVDPYSASTTGSVKIVAFQDCDIALRHKESFARGNNSL